MQDSPDQPPRLLAIDDSALIHRLLNVNDASFGVTDLDRAADEAMYAAKQTGRNRVAIAPSRHHVPLAAG